MSFSNQGANLPGIVAGADLTTRQFRAIIIDATGRAALAGADVAIDGILQNNPNTDEPATIWGPGSVSKVIVGTGGATRGTLATTAADGMKDAAATDVVAGRFLETGVAGVTVALWMGPQAGGVAP